jgi:hypothetical protein
MTRILQAMTVLAVVGVSAPSFACSRHTHGGLSVTLGNLFFGIGVLPCPAPVVVAQPAPVYVVPPPPVYAPPAVAYVAPPPPPVVVAPPLVAPPAPAVNVTVQQPRETRPALLGLKYLGGSASLVNFNGGLTTDGLGYAQSAGVELRLNRWFGLRSDFELRPDSRSWDLIGAKLWVPWSVFKPYASVSLAVSEAYSQPGLRHWGVVGAAGLDVWLGRHFFLEAEGRYRVSPGDCCRDQPHFTGLVGAGFAFF